MDNSNLNADNKRYTDQQKINTPDKNTRHQKQQIQHAWVRYFHAWLCSSIACTSLAFLLLIFSICLDTIKTPKNAPQQQYSIYNYTKTNKKNVNSYSFCVCSAIFFSQKKKFICHVGYLGDFANRSWWELIERSKQNGCVDWPFFFF